MSTVGQCGQETGVVGSGKRRRDQVQIHVDHIYRRGECADEIRPEQVYNVTHMTQTLQTRITVGLTAGNDCTVRQTQQKDTTTIDISHEIFRIKNNVPYKLNY